ncbi:MAG TPA: ABC transporter ATP-binding protein [Bacilli bacterium]|nr:ABC transporter ATP-binding protein [Bacilli bacterium]
MKYFKIMYKMTEGFRKHYLLVFIMMFFNIALNLILSYLNAILIDVLNNDIPNGYIPRFILELLGGQTYLRQNIWLLAVLIVSVGLTTAVISATRHSLRGYISTNIGKRTQLKLFHHIERLPYESLKKMQSGDIIQTCTRDEEVLRRFVIFEVSMIVYTTMLVSVSFVILLDISWQLALTAIGILPMMMIYSFFFVKRVRKLYRIADESEAQMTAKIEENIRGTRTVKAYNNEKHEIDNFENYLKDYENKALKFEKTNSIYISTSDIFVFGQITLTTLFGIYLTYIGQISVGALYLGITYVSQIVWPVRSVASILSNLAKAVASMDRMNIIYNQPLEDLDSGDKPELKGAIEFKNVSFKYDDGEELILKNINLTIKSGQTVAIMGKTGAGKSTFAHLLSRLHDVNEGHILIDGHDIQSINRQHLRKSVATVLQEPFLFSKTIISNLRIANEKASEEAIFKAAQIAHIHDSILTFKNGYDTAVGEHGVTLSGGQKQRLAIARTIINQAPILIFDDSLSAVDTETDIQIRSALKMREKDSHTTTLIVTHRVATAKDADFIIVLDKGNISQIGTHDELINQEGLYHRIYEIQSRMA